MELIALKIGGQAMHNNLTGVSLVIGATGAIYHIAVLVALAAVLM
jgi:hypothetical protein